MSPIPPDEIDSPLGGAIMLLILVAIVAVAGKACFG